MSAGPTVCPGRLAGLLLLLAGAILGAACTADLGLDQGRGYPCGPDAGGAQVCAPGWRCGLDALCHARDAGAAYACRDDGDCEQGWRCGQSGTCHDRVPAAYACATSADCEGSWRCGLAGLCHDPAVAAAYPCQQDSDCEQGWRCNPLGACVDAAADALAASSVAGALSHVRVSPQLSVSPGDPLAFNIAGAQAQAIDFVHAGTLTHLEHDPAGLLLPDGGRTLAVTARFPLPAGTQLATLATHGRVTYLLRDGGVDRFVFDLDGGTYGALSTISGEQLRIVDGSQTGYALQPDLLLVFQGTRLDAINSATGAAVPLTHAITATDGGWQQLHDVLGVIDSSTTGSYLLAAAEQGLYVARPDAGGYAPWEPFDLPGVPNGSCGGNLAGGLEVMRVRALYGTVLGFEARPRGDAGTDRYGILFNYIGTPGGMSCPWPLPYALGMQAGSCLLCPPGEQLVDFGVEDSRNSLNARCRTTPAAGAPQEHVDTLYPGGLDDGGCSRRPASAYSYGGVQTTLFEDAVVVPAPPFQEGDGLGLGRYGYGYGYLGAHGTLWSAAPGGSSGLNRTALTLDTAPDAVAGSGSALVTRTGGDNEPSTSRFLPGLGQVTEQRPGGLSELVTGVEGQPSWAVFSRHSPLGAEALEVWTRPEGGALLATSALSPVPLPGPFGALAAPLPDGGTQLLVRASDALLAADVTAALLGGAPAALEVRDVPEPGSALLSITALTPAPLDGGAPLVFGYALTANRLFEVRELLPSRWVSEEVAVPPREWLEVWSDGARGRLGDVDGEVYSLPSRVPLSGPLPAGRAVDFAQLCGQTFALGTDNLYRLTPAVDGGPIGQWELEDIRPQLPPGDVALDGGRLYSTHTELDVFTRFGTLVRLDSGGCQ